MKYTDLIKVLNDGTLDSKLISLYGEGNLSSAKARYTDAAEKFAAEFGADRELSVYTVSGRSELSGNHTDHNRGCVLAASINLDIIAIASPTDDGIVTVKSEGFGKDAVNINAYTSPVTEKFGTSESIIAGMCAGLREKGYNVGGFVAYATSNVLKGSGLSSSAAFITPITVSVLYTLNAGIAKLPFSAKSITSFKLTSILPQPPQVS